MLRRNRLFARNVQKRPAPRLLAQRPRKVGLHHLRAAPGVDKGRVRLHAGEQRVVQHVHGLRVVGKVIGNYVALGKQRFKAHLFRLQLGGARVADERIEQQNFKRIRVQLPDHARADRARTNDADFRFIVAGAVELAVGLALVEAAASVQLGGAIKALVQVVDGGDGVLRHKVGHGLRGGDHGHARVQIALSEIAHRRGGIQN